MLENDQDPATQEGVETESKDAADASATAADSQAEEADAKGTEGGAVEGKPEGKSEEKAAGAQTTEDESQFEVVLEGEEPPPKVADSPVIRDLRKRYRESEEKRLQLERTLATVQGQATQAADPGPEPTLEGNEYDAEKFKAAWKAWNSASETKAKADAEAAKMAQAHQREWQGVLTSYATQKAELSKQIPDYADRENAVKAMFNGAQQDVLLASCEKPALVVAALGRNPELAKDMVNETNLVRLAAKFAKLEVRLKMSKSTKAPPAERKIQGGGAPSGAVDTRLEQLRDEAAKTGDFTKVNAYKRQQRDKLQQSRR